MKKATYILVLLVAAVSVYGQSLKGFSLGGKLTGENNKFTTVASIEGVVLADTLKDGRIYSLAFSPLQDSSLSRISEYQLEDLIKGMELNYNVKLEPTTKECEPLPKDYEGEQNWYGAKSDGVEYMITIVDYDENLGTPYLVFLGMSDQELFLIKEQEIRSDF